MRKAAKRAGGILTRSSCVAARFADGRQSVGKCGRHSNEVFTLRTQRLQICIVLRPRIARPPAARARSRFIAGVKPRRAAPYPARSQGYEGPKYASSVRRLLATIRRTLSCVTARVVPTCQERRYKSLRKTGAGSLAGIARFFSDRRKNALPPDHGRRAQAPADSPKGPSDPALTWSNGIANHAPRRRGCLAQLRENIPEAVAGTRRENRAVRRAAFTPYFERVSGHTRLRDRPRGAPAFPECCPALFLVGLTYIAITLSAKRCGGRDQMRGW